MKIRKYDAGGIFTSYTPILDVPVQSPVGMADGTSGSASTDDKGKGDLMEKDVLKKLLGSGLSNEVNQFMLELDKQSSGYMNTGNRQSIYRLFATSNELIQNKKMFDTALTEANTNNGLQEVAVNDSGAIYAKTDSGELSLISAKQLAKNPNKYYTLTNGELATMRANDMNLVHRNDITNSIRNSIGADKVTNQIMEIIGKIGTETFKQNTLKGKEEMMQELQSSIQGLNGRKPTAEEAEAIQSLNSTLASVEGQDGLFDITKMTSSERNHFNKAMNYIASMLPKNSMNVLKAKAATQGKDISKVENLLKDALIFGTNYSEETDIKFKNADGSDKDGSVKGQRELTQYEDQIKGTGGRPMSINFGGGLTWTVNAKHNDALVGADNQNIQPGTIETLLNSSMGNVLDKKSISFGGQQVIDPSSVVYDGKGGDRVMLPTKRTDDGAYVPDLEKMNALETLTKSITPNMSDKMIQDILNKHGFDYLQYNKNTGQFISRPGREDSYQPFLMVTGYGGTGSFQKNRFLSNLEDNDFFGDDANTQRIKELFVTTSGEGKNKTSRDGFSKSWAWNGAYDAGLLEGKIFIKLDEHAESKAATLTGSGPTVGKVDYATQVARNQAISNRAQGNTINASSNALGY